MGAKSGRLILCATPIGNLADITQRALTVLGSADLIACEDTRRTRKLLTHHGISARSLTVYNEGNERRKAGELARAIGAGRTVVLVSDAGMPGLSDPGYRLVRACVELGYPVEVAPGPSAVVSALAVSGLPPGRFVFEGFLPRKSGDRRRRIGELRDEPRTIVLYESPHRAAEALADLADLLGDRPAALVRELTKLHEEVRRGSLPELASQAASDPLRGEIVVVVGGAVGGHRAAPARSELAARARALMDSGMDRRDAMTTVARDAGVARRAVFDALVGDEE